MQSHLLVGPLPSTGFPPPPSSPTAAALPYPLLRSTVTGATHKSPPAQTPRPLGPTAIIIVYTSDWNQRRANHYTVLGVARNASSADIKRAYRLLARKYHPDVSKDSRASEVFMTIRHAYEVLSNEVTRIRYDRALTFQEDVGRSYKGKWNHSPNFEDGVGGGFADFMSFIASWVCGKNSSSVVVLVVVAMWVGSNLARYAPLPHGALLTLLYMSIKLQVDLN
ncbi:Adenosine-5'-phosphosulfate (APS) kinase 3 isoform 1 [Hibiscus syriacus]|uniref:Adenosine-5'-phosphosulfate (APS) kinase 3 isoform 1 n=1 Tax=Hibiscus syriacus TaxID=106335 RepID=A0A6A3B3X5_HIBSY|nr:Adenosine-5'-phosphosulfate (APS) kinase 3 isoform 1 [Hibiscus syriacus]